MTPQKVRIDFSKEKKLEIQMATETSALILSLAAYAGFLLFTPLLVDYVRAADPPLPANLAHRLNAQHPFGVENQNQVPGALPSSGFPLMQNVLATPKAKSSYLPQVFGDLPVVTPTHIPPKSPDAL